RKLNWSCQRPAGRALECDEQAIRRWKKYRWPQIKKSASRKANHCLRRRERTERTPASRADLGATRTDSGPAVSFHMEGAVGGRWDHLVKFLLPTLSPHNPRRRSRGLLSHLLRHLPGKLLVVWDGLPAHRGRAVKEFLAAHQSRLAVEELPAY